MAKYMHETNKNKNIYYTIKTVCFMDYDSIRYVEYSLWWEEEVAICHFISIQYLYNLKLSEIELVIKSNLEGV